MKLPQREQKALKRAELSSKFGDMPEDQFRELVEDIRENALCESILIRKGFVIDGWHRHRALLEIGHPPQDGDYEEYDSAVHGDIEQYVYTRNLYRRQMSTEDRIAIAIAKTGYVPTKGKPKPGQATQSDVAQNAGVSVATIKRHLSNREKAPPTLEDLLKKQEKLQKQLEEVEAEIEKLKSISKPAVRAVTRRQR